MVKCIHCMYVIEKPSRFHLEALCGINARVLDVVLFDDIECDRFCPQEEYIELYKHIDWVILE